MPSPALRPSEGFLTGRTVLVVEDHRDSRHLLGQMLESWGARVLLAEDGLAGLWALRKQPVDLILADILMPRLDGLRFLERVRWEFKLTKLPVIAVTALGQDRDYFRTFEAGFDAHLTKPIDYELVAAVISRVLPGPGSPVSRRRTRPLRSARDSRSDPGGSAHPSHA